MTLVRLRGRIQNYAWGSRTAIAELQGRHASELPEAELWLGAHPRFPALLAEPHEQVEDLAALIAQDRRRYLGASRDELPFLFKVLAASSPLSLQAHPNQQQAQAGFAREEEQGIFIDAAERNYKDTSHKPELFCALSPFRALSGFREPADAVNALSAFVGEERGLDDSLRALEGRDIEKCFRGFFALDAALLQSVVAQIRRRGEASELLPGALRAVAPTMVALATKYPGDPGVLGALLLNYVELAPGEAMYLPAGNLHAYVEGVGLEIMASSDNVLRGGLTPKHVDVPELCRVLRFEALSPDLITGTNAAPSPGVEVIKYETPATEFELSRVRLQKGSWDMSGPAIVLILEGDLRGSASGGPASCGKGESFFVSASEAVRWEGAGELAVAAVPAAPVAPV